MVENSLEHKPGPMSNDNDELATYQFCPECGTKAANGARFCGECGRSLLKQVVPAAGQISSPLVTSEVASVEGASQSPVQMPPPTSPPPAFNAWNERTGENAAIPSPLSKAQLHPKTCCHHHHCSLHLQHGHRHHLLTFPRSGTKPLTQSEGSIRVLRLLFRRWPSSRSSLLASQ